jgi:hypothetical protein
VGRLALSRTSEKGQYRPISCYSTMTAIGAQQAPGSVDALRRVQTGAVAAQHDDGQPVAVDDHHRNLEAHAFTFGESGIRDGLRAQELVEDLQAELHERRGS